MTQTRQTLLICHQMNKKQSRIVLRIINRINFLVCKQKIKDLLGDKIEKFFVLFCRSAVPARNAKGDRLLLYMGIIDILQSYRFKKRIEHTLKSMITDGVSKFIYIAAP